VGAGVGAVGGAGGGVVRRQAPLNARRAGLAARCRMRARARGGLYECTSPGAPRASPPASRALRAENAARVVQGLCVPRRGARPARARANAAAADSEKSLAPFRRSGAASLACSLAPSLPRALARAPALRRAALLPRRFLADKVGDEARGPEAGGIWLGARFEDCKPAGGPASAAAVDLRATVVPAFETVRVIGSAGPGKKPVCVDISGPASAEDVIRKILPDPAGGSGGPGGPSGGERRAQHARARRPRLCGGRERVRNGRLCVPCRGAPARRLRPR